MQENVNNMTLCMNARHKKKKIPKVKFYFCGPPLNLKDEALA